MFIHLSIVTSVPDEVEIFNLISERFRNFQKKNEILLTHVSDATHKSL